MTRPPNLSVDDGIEQALQTLLVVVHAGAEVGYDLERPTLAGAVEFEHLLLPFQVVFLVVAGDACIGNGSARRFGRMELLGT